SALADRPVRRDLPAERAGAVDRAAERRIVPQRRGSGGPTRPAPDPRVCVPGGRHRTRREQDRSRRRDGRAGGVMVHTPTTAHPRRWWILGALCLSLLVLVIDNSILNLAIPALMDELDATPADIQ